MAHLNIMTATKMTHVPYKGGDAAGIGLAGGELQAMVASMPIVRPHLGGNRIRVLAVTSETRMKQLADTPTLAEAGVPGYEFTAWVAAFVPAGTPRPIVDKLSAEIMRILNEPEVLEKMKGLAFVPARESRQEFEAYIAIENTKWQKVVQDAGVKIE